jgi:transcriptional regulator with XRE-family HTH domain
MQVGRLEAGACTPSWDTVQRLAAALESTPDELFPPNDEDPAGQRGLAATSTDAAGPRDDAIVRA